MEPVMCKTCKTAEAEDGQVRCRVCHAAFRRWLDGGVAYLPKNDGIVAVHGQHYYDLHPNVRVASKLAVVPVDLQWQANAEKGNNV